MPYAVLSILLFVGAVAYVFGETYARIAVAMCMAFCSCAILGLVYITAMDINRQIYAKPTASVKYGAPR